MLLPQVPWSIYFSCLAGNDREKPYFWIVKKVRILFVLLGLILGGMFTTYDASAQCPMCKMSAESNLKNGGTTGRGLNAGIIYMLALPYTLVGTIGFIWWRNNRRKNQDDEEQSEA
jgi:hypothetical protein